MLGRIQAMEQHVAEAMASLLGIDVDVVDENMVRVAGTGRFRAGVNQPVKDRGFYAGALQAGVPVRLEGPATGESTGDICCPIRAGERTIGLLGFSARRKTPPEPALWREDKLLEFAQRMADLIGAAAMQQHVTSELELMTSKLATVLDSVHEGIVALDASGRVSAANRMAQQMLGLSEHEMQGLAFDRLVGDDLVSRVLKGERPLRNVEVSLKRSDGTRAPFIVSIERLRVDRGMEGAVCVLQDTVGVHSLVGSMATSQPELTFDEIIGESPAIRAVKEQAAKIAQSDSTVLILGESGTGKELFARAIHAASRRKDHPFIVINCAAIPESLLESELFGYVDGAFTGARRGGKPGKFELANGGTIFLDEVGDIPLHLQVKILRVLQEREVERVGGSSPIRVNVRVLAATHRNLEERIVRGEFRADLYYRLNVIPLFTPALRQRGEDVLLLAESFLKVYAKRLGKRIFGLTHEAREAIQRYEWPGNVRELQNAMEYAANMTRDGWVKPCDLSPQVRANEQAAPPSRYNLRSMEQQLIREALREFGTTVEGKRRAAEALGIDLTTLYRKLKAMKQMV